VLRQLRLAGAWAGRCQVDSYLAGDGETQTVARLAGTTGTAELSLEIGDPEGQVRSVQVTLRQ